MTRRATLMIVLALCMTATAAANAKAPAPSNGRIAFSRYDPLLDDNVTYTVNPDGSDTQPLFPGYSSNAPHWSPDGSRVAVFSGLGAECSPQCTGNTVIIDPDTGAYDVLAPQGLPELGTFCSIWSPDATHFACEGGNDFDRVANGVYVIRSSDGGGLTRLTDAGGASDVPIDYSPDGQRIVFGRLDPENHSCSRTSALYVVNVDGSGLRRITPPGFCDDDGSWSPDGSEIAFEHRGSLFVVHPDGGGLMKIPLAVNSRAFAGDVSWSPDGKKLVFLLGTPTGPQSWKEGIATANADGTGVHYVTTSPTFDHQPDWGADTLAAG
jgi:TolB protein